MNLSYKKIVLITILCSLFLPFSCDNNEESNLNDENNNSANEILTRSMSELMGQFDAEGNADYSENPTGNMVLDFCFEFIFPIDFEISNNSIETVESLDELIELLIQSNDDYYISNILYPFEVMIFDEDNDSMEVLIIENEEDFNILLDDCEFDSDEDDACYEIYDPVCVLISDMYGDDVIVVYPNDCYAAQDGFTSEDFLDDCDNDHDDYEGDLFYNDCFDLVYPITLINSDGETITAESELELLNLIEQWYSDNCNVSDCEFDFELTYPLTVEYYSENSQQVETITINSEEELEEYIDDYCDFEDDDSEDDWHENDCFELVYPVSVISSNGDVITGNSEEELMILIEQWYSENCNNFECDFDFELVYPVTVEFYNEELEETVVFIIESEEEMENYFEEFCD